MNDPLGWLGEELDGRVAIEEVVGEGGYGVVYRGRHLGFDDPVAVKCLKVPAQLADAQRESFVKRLRREARTLHRLSRRTTAIVQALDVGAAASPTGLWTPYMVMEWLEGKTLDAELRDRAAWSERGWPVDRAVDLLATALEGMAVAHDYGVAHLDLKPANLFVVQDDDQEPRLKVLDFGIARAFAQQHTLGRSMTQGREAMTPGYAAPEQYERSFGRVGPASDVFALGLILLEMASGRPALEGDTPLQLYLSAVKEERRPSFRALGVEAPAALDEVVQGALAVQVADRYADASVLLDALRAAKGEGATASSKEASTDSAVSAPRDALATGYNRVCTVVMVELLASPIASPTTTGPKLDAEQTRRLTRRGREALGERAEALGGMAHALTGDATMFIFGMRDDDGYSAERALRATLHMREAVGEVVVPKGVELAARFGAQTGRIFVAGGAAATDIVGAPVKLASRLQHAANPGEILVGPDAHRQTAGLFEVEPRSLPPLASGEPEGRAYRLVSDGKRRDRLDTSADRDFLGLTTEFVGRQAELGVITRCADEVVEQGQPLVVLVEGARGMGKSRLLLEVANQIERDGFSVLTAVGSPLRQRIGYGLAAAMLRTHLHIHEDDPRDVAAVKIRRRLKARSRGAARRRGRRSPAVATDETVELLLRVLGLSAPVVSGAMPRETDSEAVRHRVAAAFATILRRAEGPLALLADDIQWADPASLELLDDLPRRMGGEPVLVVGAIQQGFVEPASWSPHKRVSLERMAQRHLERMARDRLSRVENLDDDLVTRLVRRAEGVPLVLVATLHLFVDAGAVDVREPSRWTVDAERAAALRLPTTVQEIVQARLDRLSATHRALVCEAAVIGRVFWVGCLEAADADAPRASAQLTAALDALVARRVLIESPGSRFPGEREYRFAESNTHEVAYEMLSEAARRPIHGQVAQWLRARTAGAGESALVAHHFERAGALVEAVDWYRTAGRHAANLGHNDEASACFGRACRIGGWLAGELDDESPVLEEEELENLPWSERVAMAVEQGDVLRQMGELDRAEAEYARGEALVGEPDVDDPGSMEKVRWKTRLAYRRAQVGQLRGEVEGPRAVLEEALAASQVLPMREERALMLALLAALHRRERDDEAATAACLEGISVCRTRGRRGSAWREAVSRLLQTLGTIAYRQRRYLRAERLYLQSSRVLFEEREPHLAARTVNNVAAARYARGDLESAASAFERALELAERSGDMRMTMTALSNLGEVRRSLGATEEAGELLEEAAEIGERIGAQDDLADVYRNLVIQRAAEGRAQDAVAAAVAAVDRSATEGGCVYRPAVLETIAECVTSLRRADVSDLVGALSSVAAADATQTAARELAERLRGGE